MDQEVNFGAASSSSPINQDSRDKRATENNSHLLDSLSIPSLQASLIGIASAKEFSVTDIPDVINAAQETSDRLRRMSVSLTENIPKEKGEEN